MARTGESRAVSRAAALPVMPRRAPEGAEPRRARQGADDVGVRQPADFRGVRRPRRLELTRSREPDREPHPARDPRSSAFPQRRRRRLSDARPKRRDAVGRRGPAHPAGDANRVEPHRRALRPRRAVNRPSPARQSGTALDARAASRSRKHGRRRRARRGDDSHRRLRHRSGAGCRVNTVATSSSRAPRRRCSRTDTAR